MLCSSYSLQVRSNQKQMSVSLGIPCPMYIPMCFYHMIHFILDTCKKVIWKTVKTRMKCQMRHFIRACTVCQDKSNHTTFIQHGLFHLLENPNEWKGLIFISRRRPNIAGYYYYLNSAYLNEMSHSAVTYLRILYLIMSNLLDALQKWVSSVSLKLKCSKAAFKMSNPLSNNVLSNMILCWATYF